VTVADADTPAVVAVTTAVRASYPP